MSGVWATEKRSGRGKGKYEYVRAATRKNDVMNESGDDLLTSGIYDVQTQKKEAANDDKLLDKLQRPYFLRTPRPGEHKPLDYYSETAERDGSGRKTAKLMHWISGDDLQQLAVRQGDEKSIFMASSSKSPTKAHPSADMKHFEKAQSKKMLSQNFAALHSMGGKREGAAALELERPKKWSTTRLKPFVESEKSLMLSNMLPFVSPDRENEELKELQGNLAIIKKEKNDTKKTIDSGISNPEIKETLGKLDRLEEILEIRIKRLNEIIMKKDYSKRRMQQRLTLVSGLMDEIRFNSGDITKPAAIQEDKQEDDEDKYKNGEDNKMMGV